MATKTATPNGKAKTNGKRPAHKASDPFKVTYEKMQAFEVQYMRNDLKAAQALSRLLHEKFLASLTPEQYAAYTTVNGFRAMYSDVFAREEHEAQMRELPINRQTVGQFYTLDKVRKEITRIKTLLLGFPYDDRAYQQRAAEADAVVSGMAKAQAEQEPA
jgi:hypothetical protein